MASDLNFPFPQIEAPLTTNYGPDGKPVGIGKITQVWLNLFATLWTRTGGAAGIDSEEALLLAVAGEPVPGSEEARFSLLATSDVQRIVNEALALHEASRPQIDPLSALLFETYRPAGGDAGADLGAVGSTATSDTPSSCCASWVPLVDGSEPPVFITDGAGHLIFVAYGP